jgi:Flp pilus assembly protein TadB
VTLWLPLSLALALLASVFIAGCYLMWPRTQSPEEWVMRRRAAREPHHDVPALDHRLELPLPVGSVWLQSALRWLNQRSEPDLAMISLKAAQPVDLRMARLALIGAGLGVLAGLMITLVGGEPLFSVGLLTICAALLAPAMRWLRLRRQAAQIRRAVRRRLPRLLTAARVLLESGAVTPSQALIEAAGVYQDTASDVLREALRDREVRRVALSESLERTGRALALAPLRQLAEAFQVGTQHGTEMGDLLAGMAQDLRHRWHAEYKERITRAPVLMTLPALVFFVFPLLVVILLLVFVPLVESLSRI